MRLAAHVSWRNRGHGEDRRCQAIRARNQPHFAAKRFYRVFALQALLAWLVSIPFLVAAAQPSPWTLARPGRRSPVVFGIAFEAVADRQLAAFKADPANRGEVLDRGVWRTTRHPDYFGECCVWWGLFDLWLGAGSWWASSRRC